MLLWRRLIPLSPGPYWQAELVAPRNLYILYRFHYSGMLYTSLVFLNHDSSSALSPQPSLGINLKSGGSTNCMLDALLEVSALALAARSFQVRHNSYTPTFFNEF